jgi:hypothetical protein
MLGGNFPKSSGVAGQAAEQHPAAADHCGRSVGAADAGLRARSGAQGPALVAASPGRSVSSPGAAWVTYVPPPQE